MIALLMLVAALLLLGGLYWLFMSSYSQVFGAYPYRAKRQDKVIALTFDDGPNEPYTSQILDYLNEKGVRATFFEVGVCVERHPEVTQKIAASGHVIGNHSLSHAFHNYFTSLTFRHEIEQTQTILQKYLGKTPLLYRSPWLWRQPFLLGTVRRLGLQPVSGVFGHPMEPFQPDGERMARVAIKRAKPGSIIIFHDGFDGRGGDRSQTVRAVKLVVDALLEQGYTFVTVDELLGVPAYSEVK